MHPSILSQAECDAMIAAVDPDPNCQLDEDAPPTAVQVAVIRECAAIRDMLLEKNRRYGNSALNPLRVFSSAAPDEQIKVRIDDKLSRIRTTAVAGDDEDAILDLIGYLILLRIARQEQRP